MAKETPEDPRHPRLRMRGPKASVPEVGSSASGLPYSGEPQARPRWAAIAVLGLLIGLVAAVAIIAAVSNDGGDGATAARSAPPSSAGDGSASPASTTSDGNDETATRESGASDQTTTTAEATTTTAEATTTTTPATTTTGAPTSTVPVDQLPPHEAVYQDGKLVLQGTLPNREVAEEFRQKAAEVIGDQNVIVNYQFDPRVPVPTDGHVRVAEQFIFPKNSAEVNPAYLKIFDLGVAVLKLNPQATMRIRGYTDDSGPDDFNQRLSQDRAQAAANYLIYNGIDPKRLTVVGFGEADPAVPNDSDENRAQNRRIQVDLYNLLAA